MDYTEIAETLGEQTPSYVFDVDRLLTRVTRIKNCLKKENISLCYAMKANPFLIGVLHHQVERLEVCSPGEFRICEREQVPMDRLVISGVNKEQEDIRRIVSSYQGRGIFTIESLQQWELLKSCAKEAEKELQVLLRLTSGNQFGVDWEMAEQMIAEGKQNPQLRVLGIQYYSGTQKKKMAAIEKELDKLDGFCQEILEKYQIALAEIEYGPGFFVPYFQTEEDLEVEEILQPFLEAVGRMKFSGKLTLEMGRFIAAECGSFFTALVDRKENDGQLYGIVDGGIHHLNYFGQTMAMKLPHVTHIPKKDGQSEGSRAEEPEVDDGNSATESSGMRETEEKWNICGSLCTTADVIVKQLPLKHAKIGDILVFERTGAYSVTEGINLFLSRDLPGVWSYSQKEGLQLLRARQSTDGLNSQNLT